jgi:hypothetical protein
MLSILKRKKTFLDQKKILINKMSKISSEKDLLKFTQKQIRKKNVSQEFCSLVISHEYTTLAVLRKLAEQEISCEIAEDIASSPLCDEDTLRVLWYKYPGGRHCGLRYIIGGHLNAPLDFLESWAHTQSAGDRREIARNPKTPTSILIKMLEKEKIDWVVEEIVKNKNLPSNLAVQYALSTMK